jgi:hypothetical protein
VRAVTQIVTSFKIMYFFNRDLSTTDVTKGGQLTGVQLKVSKVIATEIYNLKIQGNVCLQVHVYVTSSECTIFRVGDKVNIF